MYTASTGPSVTPRSRGEAAVTVREHAEEQGVQLPRRGLQRVRARLRARFDEGVLVVLLAGGVRRTLRRSAEFFTHSWVATGNIE